MLRLPLGRLAREAPGFTRKFSQTSSKNEFGSVFGVGTLTAGLMAAAWYGTGSGKIGGTGQVPADPPVVKDKAETKRPAGWQKTEQELPILTPQEYANKFQAREAFGPFQGVCGRFIRGQYPKHFEKLSDEPGKRLSWICDPELLQPLLGKEVEEAMLTIGFSPAWMLARCHDDPPTQHKLALFPSTEGTQATWDGIFKLIRSEYGEDVYKRLEPHIPALKTTPYLEIDPMGDMWGFEVMSVEDKYAHPDYLTADRFLALEDVTLLHARGFLDHSLGCNKMFTGSGFNSKGQPEFLTKCRRLDEIEGLVLLDLQVDAERVQAMMVPKP